MGGRVEIGIELMISCSDTMINHWLSPKLKLLENGEFNYFTINSNTSIKEMGASVILQVIKF